jgi:hypothetical protein
MVSMRANQMAEFFASVTQQMSKADVDLATIDDIVQFPA